MISLCEIDVAFRRVRDDNPDLDIDLLSLDDRQLREKQCRINALQVRSALVARIADIVKQSARETNELEGATAMVAVLVYTYSGEGERPGHGHKHAMQGIQLLASTSGGFDTSVDLFFDLVERFWTFGRGDGKVTIRGAVSSDAFVARMMQNYDQTLIKLISKHWAAAINGEWSLSKAQQRIRTLRDQLDFGDAPKMPRKSWFRFSKRSSALFCESFKMLDDIHKKRFTEMTRTRQSGEQQPHEIAQRIRKTTSMRPLSSWRKSGAPEFRPQVDARPGTSHGGDGPVSSAEPQRKISRMDAEIVDLRQQVKLLCSVLERSEHERRHTLSEESSTSMLDSGSSYTLAEDSDTLRDFKLAQMKLYHAV